MSGNEETPNTRVEDEDSDPLADEMINRAQQHKEFLQAIKSAQTSFTSFSEGMPTVSKFEILDENAAGQSIKKSDISGKSKVDSPSKPDPLDRDSKDFFDPKSPFLQSRPANRNSDANPPEKAVEVGSFAGNFKSFSEGLPAIQKFEILGQEDKSEIGKSVEKTSRVGNSAQDIQLSLMDFIHSSHCTIAGLDQLVALVVETQHREDRLLDTTALVLERLLRVPWLDEIKVNLRPGQAYLEYDFASDTIHLDPRRESWQQVLDFAHQGYHATNKLLTPLYGKDLLQIDQFQELHIWSEIAALITEINAGKDLGIQEKYPVLMECLDADGNRFEVDVELFIKQRGMKELAEYVACSFIRGHDNQAFLTSLERLMLDYSSRYNEGKAVVIDRIEQAVLSGFTRESV